MLCAWAHLHQSQTLCRGMEEEIQQYWMTRGRFRHPNPCRRAKRRRVPEVQVGGGKAGACRDDATVVTRSFLAAEACERRAAAAGACCCTCGRRATACQRLESSTNLRRAHLLTVGLHRIGALRTPVSVQLHRPLAPQLRRRGQSAGKYTPPQQKGPCGKRTCSTTSHAINQQALQRPAFCQPAMRSRPVLRAPDLRSGCAAPKRPPPRTPPRWPPRPSRARPPRPPAWARAHPPAPWDPPARQALAQTGLLPLQTPAQLDLLCERCARGLQLGTAGPQLRDRMRLPHTPRLRPVRTRQCMRRP